VGAKVTADEISFAIMNCRQVFRTCLKVMLGETFALSLRLGLDVRFQDAVTVDVVKYLITFHHMVQHLISVVEL
jgi:hypothetical protein